jgi:hypothetical protein
MPYTPEDGSEVFDPRLKELSIRCPECGTLIYGSGRMAWNALTKRWYVDYWCPIDRETIPKWSDSAESTIRAVAASQGY